MRPRSEEDDDRWDALVDAAPMGTFLHSRRFLSHHGDRFDDCSLLIEDQRGSLRAVLPIARSRADASIAVSHPSATHGGLVHRERNAAERVPAMLDAAIDELRRRGYSRFEYKPVPLHLQRGPCHADVHHVWRLGGRIVRRDLWNAIDLQWRPGPSSNRRRTVAHARARGVAVREDNSHEAYSMFWEILATRLRERYQVTPVHSADEMRMLREHFPGRISLWVVLDPAGEMVGGSWVFDFGVVARHTQYLASTPLGSQLFAVDLLIQTLIDKAAEDGVRTFSLGASTEPNGRLNTGLFDYKSRFGRGSITHDHYELDLTI